MTNLELTINSHGKVYNIDVSDWDAEKWATWGEITEEWTELHYFCFTRYMDSVTNDVWDASMNKRKITFMGRNQVNFCRKALMELENIDIFELPDSIYESLDFDNLEMRLRDTLYYSKGLKVIEEDDTGIYYSVKE